MARLTLVRICFLLALELLFLQAQAFYRWLPPPNMCTPSHTPAPLSGPAPPIPSLPKQYSMKVEANILQKSWTTEVEEHYDGINERASVSLTSNGSTTVTIFNFKLGEKYEIYPNGSCQTRPNSIDVFGFAMMNKQGRSTMATVNEVFRFGAGFNQTYVGKETVRGIQVNHWSSCQEWSVLGAKFQLDYYFSDPDFITAGGTEQIPVRAVLNGSARNVGMLSQHLKGNHTFQHIYEFMSFRTGPVFNEEVFQIPPGVVCHGRSDASKKMPELPDRFEMSMETVIPKSKMHPLQQFLRYDYNHKLIETWSVMVAPADFDLVRLHREPKPVDPSKLVIYSTSVVEDFQTGVMYIIDKMNMTCQVQKMTPSLESFGMSHGKNLLQIANSQASGDHSFVYQGQTTVREMLVDVWAAEANGITQEVYFLADNDHSRKHQDGPTQTAGHDHGSSKSPSNPNIFPTLVGMFMKNRTNVNNNDLSRIFRTILTPDAMQWTGVADGTDKPDSPKMHFSDQLSWGVQMERMLDRSVAEKVVNVFNYSPMHTESINFQVSLCYKDDEMSQIMFVVQTNYDSNVLNNFAVFSNSLRNAIAEKTGVSVLQISNLVPVPLKYPAMNIDATTVKFTLLGSAPVENSKQVSLAQAKKNLIQAIKNGITFEVQYASHAKSFVVDKSLYTIDYDKVNLPSEDGAKIDLPAAPNKQTDSDDSKYSPGAVAGIAFATLILGAVLCLSVVFLLYRRKHPGESVIPYRMTT